MKKLKGLMLIAASLTATAALAAAQPEPSNSLLASGRWAKVKVEADGVFQLSDAKLRELGFADPSKVRLYGYSPILLLTHDSSVIPNDLVALPSVYENGKITFYAKAHVDTAVELWGSKPTDTKQEHSSHVSSQSAAYFLSDVEQPVAIASVASPSESVTATDVHRSLIYCEKDNFNWGIGGTFFIMDEVTNPTQVLSYDVTLRKPAPSGAGSVVFQGVMKSSRSTNNSLVVNFPDGWTGGSTTGGNATALTDHILFNEFRHVRTFTAPTGLSGDIKGKLTFSLNPEAQGFGRGGLDFWALQYDRLNDLSGESSVIMNFTDYSKTAAQLSGMAAGDNWHVWDVTNPQNVKSCAISESGRVAIPTTPQASYPTVMVAFNTAATHPEPIIVGPVDNQNLHSMATPDMVIITSKPLMEVAEEIAAFHTDIQDYNVEVVDQQLIFNEYGSGNVAPEAVRRFMTHLYDKNPDKLKALLLLGPATYKNFEHVSDDSPYVVTCQNEELNGSKNDTRSFFSDSFYGKVGTPRYVDSYWSTRSSFYQVMGVETRFAVGRIPFGSPSEIRQYMSKVEDYVMNPPLLPSMSNVVVASDYEGNSSQPQHYYDAETFLSSVADKVDKEITATRPASNFYSATNNTVTKRILFAALERGVDIFGFFGHGSAIGIGGSAGESMIDASLAESYLTPGRYPLCFLGTCQVGEIDITGNTVALSLLRNRNGGMLNVVCSSRDVYQAQNAYLGQLFFKAYSDSNNGALAGDYFRKAQNEAIEANSGTKSYITNHMTYNYFGDPAIPVHRPTHSVKITKVNDATSACTLNVQRRNVIEGEVCNLAGSAVDPGFNGHVTITVYDTPQVLKNVASAGSNPDNSYMASLRTDHEPIGQYSGTVKNGKFTIEFNGPTPLHPGNSHRITAYAFSTSGSNRGMGYVAGVESNYDASKEQLPTSGAASILDFYAGSGQCDNYFTTGVTLHGTISAPGGLPPTSAMVSPLRLEIDGASIDGASRMLTVKGDDEYDFIYSVENMADGVHTAVLTLHDAEGNFTSREIEFTTMTNYGAEIEASTGANPGSLDIVLNSSKAFISSKVFVENLNGTLVKAIEKATFPLTVSDLPRGTYRVYTQHVSDNSYSSSPKVTVYVD